MMSKRAFAKKDVVVVAGCVVFVLMNLGAVGRIGRERAKRQVCLNNLRQLTLAWMQYANDNADRIVSGSAGVPDCSDPPNSRNIPGTGCEYPWVDFSRLPGTHPRYEQDATAAIMGEEYTFGGTTYSFHSGRALLWQYVKNIKLYRCPAGVWLDLRTYSIVDAMNGAAAYWEDRPQPAMLGPNIRIRTHIDSPGERFVFVDEGATSIDSWTVFYNRPEWWDSAPVQHNDGATFSFADGHSEYWKWTDQRTIDYARWIGDGYQPGNADLERVQIAAWGQLGYEP